ncbi:carbamoyltransferase [Streptomyces spinoverrucosus]|uniref:Carbamoyltransferase n=1 Tax=Streptomyces spinoverrucosus TaxID=284043 RepID=A0A4Y3V7W5_9ACTN|nr:carbamoyltransferase HypF [Streptomyces spinoverrucosus]GEC02423.1 carbamoyltransferase [Streptomyces spinoverrucosus]GHB43081.1 carbamoyltransferase [Streptomyces spinoverrucosus]
MSTTPEVRAVPDVRTAAVRRARVVVRGVVQGVGFRPYVYGLATDLRLAGHVTNTGDGVLVEVEGAPEAVDRFCTRIASDAPPLAMVEAVEATDLPPIGGSGFTIVPSRRTGSVRTLVAPDTATCADCLAELTDPADRRHRHPFITCTHCGPRFTIVTGLPYDREHTTMAGFPLCPECSREYHDPADRRFHAQPVACPDCGPRLSLAVAYGEAPGGDPVEAAQNLLAAGAVLAVKGVGGYHLACDATNPDAVAGLRRRKARGDKPFALMAGEVTDVEHLVHVGPVERELLTGRVRPIVLMRRRLGVRHAPPVPADAVAPGSPDLGVMLPYTPVHHLLFGSESAPRLLVMTSGNLSGEPIVTDDGEALERLAGLADAWLTHDRPIHVPCDDSVVRVCDGEPLVLRRSRGYAPLPVSLPVPVSAALAVGGDLKNVFCLGQGDKAWLSAHIGDMDDLATQRAFDRAERQLESITGVRPALLVTDTHPAYRSGAWARRQARGRPVVRVQHHHAHVAAVMAEHGLEAGSRVIGVAFDGTGHGDDGAVWGGEFLLAGYDGFRRFAHLAYVPLPGGDAAVRRPYRMALAHLHAAGVTLGPDLPCVATCPAGELALIRRQLERGLNCVPTSSMGRLFDAVSSLAGVCHHVGYEAQAAIELEGAAVSAGVVEDDDPRYAFRLADAEPVTADPGPLLAAVADDVRAGVPVGVIAVRFHLAVAGLVRAVCGAAREATGLTTVALSGGVFANTLLSSACARGLRADGFTVLRHHRIPPNDGGLALGQLVVAARPASSE